MNKLLILISLTLFTLTSKAQEYNFTTSDSVHLYVKVKGKGTPCLYIHGGPGSGSYWMEKFSGDILEKRFTMIYLDLRGVSRSSSPADGNYSMDRMIQDFEEVRKFLGFENWIIMGHSFSGTMVTGYAKEHPESINGIMMFNCSLDLTQSINESWIPKACEVLGLKDVSYFKNDTIDIHDKLNRIFPLLNEKDLTWKLAYENKDNETLMNATFNEIPNWNNDFGSIGLSHKDYMTNFKKYTPDIKMPVLFFYGENDWTIGPNHYKGVLFPNMLLWKSKVGHVPFIENKEDLAKAIDKFVKKFHL